MKPFVMTLILATLVFTSSLQAAQVHDWNRDALKLQNSLRTLNTLLSVNAFPGEVPGLVSAIGNKTSRVVEDLNTLKETIAAELPTLTDPERQEALDTFAGLMVRVADAFEELINRYLDVPAENLGTCYNTNLPLYYTMAQEYDLPSKTLPRELGGWNLPG